MNRRKSAGNPELKPKDGTMPETTEYTFHCGKPWDFRNILSHNETCSYCREHERAEELRKHEEDADYYHLRLPLTTCPVCRKTLRCSYCGDRSDDPETDPEHAECRSN